MTKKEKEKLSPIIKAADGMAQRIEQSVYEDDFTDAKGKTYICKKCDGGGIVSRK